MALHCFLKVRLRLKSGTIRSLDMVSIRMRVLSVSPKKGAFLPVISRPRKVPRPVKRTPTKFSNESWSKKGSWHKTLSTSSLETPVLSERAFTTSLCDMIGWRA